MHSVEKANDHRDFERVGLRTSAIVYQQSSSGEWHKARAWTNDLSPGGFSLLTEQPVSRDEICLRVMLNGLGEQLFHCRIARKGERQVNSLGCDQEIERFHYGVQVLGLADDETVQQIGAAEEANVATR